MSQSRHATRLLQVRAGSNSKKNSHGLVCDIINTRLIQPRRRQSLSTSSTAALENTLQQQREQEGLVVPKAPPLDHLNQESHKQSSRQRHAPLKQQAQYYAYNQNLQRQLKWQQENSRESNQFFRAAQEWYEAADAQTKFLINKPLGQLTDQDWRDAQDVLQYWCQAGPASSKKKKRNARRNLKMTNNKHNSKNVEGGFYVARALPSSVLIYSVPNSLDLLERLIQELGAHHTKDTDGGVSTLQQQQKHVVSFAKVMLDSRYGNNWVERIVYNWKIVDQKQSQAHTQHQQQRQSIETATHPENTDGDSHRDLLPDPKSLLERIEDFSRQSNSLLQLNARVYTMIMEVVIRRDILNGKPRRTSSTGRSNQADALVATPSMRQAAEFVDSLLERMQQQQNNIGSGAGGGGSIPDRRAYEAVLDAWELVCDGNRAHRRLQEFCDEYDKYTQSKDSSSTNKSSRLSPVEPSRRMFHSVLTALARGPKSSHTMEECWNLVQQMKDYHASISSANTTEGSELLDLMPTTRTYNTLLTCTLHNPHVVDPVSKAESIFEEMGSVNLRDRVSYNILLEMYSRRGMANEAASLLEQMCKEYDTTLEKQLEPNTKSFNLVLSAWTKNQQHDKGT